MVHGQTNFGSRKKNQWGLGPSYRSIPPTPSTRLTTISGIAVAVQRACVVRLGTGRILVQEIIPGIRRRVIMMRRVVVMVHLVMMVMVHCKCQVRYFNVARSRPYDIWLYANMCSGSDDKWCACVSYIIYTGQRNRVQTSARAMVVIRQQLLKTLRPKHYSEAFQRDVNDETTPFSVAAGAARWRRCTGWRDVTRMPDKILMKKKKTPNYIEKLKSELPWTASVKRYQKRCVC